ncbi:hypothetical protein CHS0354_042831 [Potamilus streckersoni]|uniref:beta-N-acetylhexosaminidase n=1 Tax=Potamilus streckersoni TaxID=2493646 RepID=A0AAE0W6Z9_9BIVA|nr:hypothetical protein CHS0354_042831 [Potamilus streckersoni]
MNFVRSALILFLAVWSAIAELPGNGDGSNLPQNNPVQAHQQSDILQTNSQQNLLPVQNLQVQHVNPDLPNQASALNNPVNNVAGRNQVPVLVSEQKIGGGPAGSIVGGQLQHQQNRPLVDGINQNNVVNLNTNGNNINNNNNSNNVENTARSFNIHKSNKTKEEARSVLNNKIIPRRSDINITVFDVVGTAFRSDNNISWMDKGVMEPKQEVILKNPSDGKDESKTNNEHKKFLSVPDLTNLLVITSAGDKANDGVSGVAQEVKSDGNLPHQTEPGDTGNETGKLLGVSKIHEGKKDNTKAKVDAVEKYDDDDDYNDDADIEDEEEKADVSVVSVKKIDSEVPVQVDMDGKDKAKEVPIVRDGDFNNNIPVNGPWNGGGGGGAINNNNNNINNGNSINRNGLINSNIVVSRNDDGNQRFINHNMNVPQGSMRIVWDWSDFAVNFEQFVMPEQKIRRAPHPTTGEPWPMPQYYIKKDDKVFRIDKTHFYFKITKNRCDVIDKAVLRYQAYILRDTIEDAYDNLQHAQGSPIFDPSQKYEDPLYTRAPYVSIVNVKIRQPCSRFPTEKSDESYDLFVKRTGVYLWANEVWGALRGLETFSQLVFRGTDGELYIKDVVINDYPRFRHRGVHIDSSRHFIFKEVIFDVLEGMAQNKMNVLHWHIVDDQSFPYQSKVYPDLSEKGAYHPSYVYTHEDIAEITEFARLRGIRVMPEFDSPGHSYSWGLSRPDLLTQCYQGDHAVDGYLGPMDPSKNETFRFLKNLFKEILHVFKDQYIHLGGDEVPMTCWSSNPEVLRLLAQLQGKQNIEVKQNDPYYYSYDIRKVLEYYVTRLTTDIKSLGRKRSNGVRFVFWQEIMNNNVQLPNDTIIQVWQGDMSDVQRAITMGYSVLYSSCWYLDLIEYGTKWSKYYHCDPADTSFGYSIDESKVLGGEACLWSEYIDNENLMTTLWPRASAAAERLWSHKDVRDLENAATRLQEHRCRMLSRGLPVGQISGPDYCLRRGKRRTYLNETVSMNCTAGQCIDEDREVIEKFNVRIEQKGRGMSDCSQVVVQAGSHLAIILLIIIVIGVGFGLKCTNGKIVQLKVCKNKTILLVFVTLIFIYVMSYTSIWMQALEFKGSFEKRISARAHE